MPRPRPFKRPIVLICHYTPVEAMTLADYLDRAIALEATGTEAATLKRIKAKLGAEMIRKKEAMVQR